MRYHEGRSGQTEPHPDSERMDKKRFNNIINEELDFHNHLQAINSSINKME